MPDDERRPDHEGRGDAEGERQHATRDATARVEVTAGDVARRALDAGVSVVAIGKGKHPPFEWGDFRTRHPTGDELDRWFSGSTNGLGVGFVMGRVSGGLECLDFESAGAFDEFRRQADEFGLADLVDHIASGYSSRTPGGGAHLLYRCTEIGPSTRLAVDEDGAVLIETRGEGSLTVEPPSPAACHDKDTGEPWSLLAGSVEIIATVSPDQRRLLHDLARLQSASPLPARDGRHGEGYTVPPGSWDEWDIETKLDFHWLDPETPLGAYNGLPDIHERTRRLLERHGWVHVGTRKGVDYLRRPGKDKNVSATLGYRGSGLLHVFSTAAPPFEAGRNYKPGHVYAMLEFDGDMHGAEHALHAEGFGRSDWTCGRCDDETSGTEHADVSVGVEEEATAASPNNVTTRLRLGGDWIAEAGDGVPGIWGGNDEIIAASGEPTMIVGPTGVGKTTLAHQYVRCRVGLDDELLGYPVIRAEGKVLVLALDRPRQAQRAAARTFADADPDVLNERLVVWQGPLPFDPARQTDGLTALADEVGASDIVVDSLKDLAYDLADGEVGARVNQALQHVVADGRNILVLHHQRKRVQGGTKPKTIDDVYGSAWLTAGMGSVVLLWGEPGDPVVEFRHLKQPADDVGPFKLLHDHTRGRTTVLKDVDPLVLARRAAHGVTARDAARQMFERAEPTRNEVEKARRRLERLCRQGKVRKVAGTPGGEGGGRESRYIVPSPWEEAS